MNAILFLYHGSLNEEPTRKHLVLIKALNPDCEVVPLSFSDDDKPWHHNHDELVYRWFDKTRPRHERFFILESDTFCTVSLKEFYGAAYYKKFVGSTIVVPWSDELIYSDRLGVEQKMRDWHWFRHNTSPELHPFLRGIIPTSGTMISHEALFGVVQLWKSINGVEKLHAECRLATLGCMAGYEPEPIMPDCNKFLSCVDVDIQQVRGIFHRVKV